MCEKGTAVTPVGHQTGPPDVDAAQWSAQRNQDPRKQIRRLEDLLVTNNELPPFARMRCFLGTIFC